MAYSITTKDPSGITTTYALSGGIAIDPSGATIIKKGIVYGEGAYDPSIGEDVFIVYPDTSTDDFDLSIVGLDVSMHYSVRAFLETLASQGNVQYHGWGLGDNSTLIITNNFIYGVDSGSTPYTGNIQYYGATLGDASTLIVVDGLVKGVDIDSGGNYTGDIVYTTWTFASDILQVVNGLVGSNYSALTYGARKEFDTLGFTNVIAPACIICANLDVSSYIDPSTYGWHCRAFPTPPFLGAVPLSIPMSILSGEVFHDTSFGGNQQEWDPGDPSGYLFNENDPQGATAQYTLGKYFYTNYQNMGSSKPSAETLLSQSDASIYDPVTQEVAYYKYVRAASLIPGSNITFDVSYNADEGTESIQINSSAVPGGYVQKTGDTMTGDLIIDTSLSVHDIFVPISDDLKIRAGNRSTGIKAGNLILKAGDNDSSTYTGGGAVYIAPGNENSNGSSHTSGSVYIGDPSYNYTKVRILPEGAASNMDLTLSGKGTGTVYMGNSGTSSTYVFGYFIISDGGSEKFHFYPTGKLQIDSSNSFIEAGGGSSLSDYNGNHLYIKAGKAFSYGPYHGDGGNLSLYSGDADSSAAANNGGNFNINIGKGINGGNDGKLYIDGSSGFTGDVSAGSTMRFRNGILIQVI